MDNLPVLYKPYKIYLHISPSGGVYVGQTKQECIKRWSNGKGYRKTTQPIIRNVIDKYGWENIEHVVLLDNLTKEEADTHEIGLIKAFRNVCDCYNISNGGYGNTGHKMDEAAKEKNRIAHLGKTHSEETRKRISNIQKGIKHSKEWVENIAKANRGKKRTDEQKKRFSEAHKNQTNDNLKKKVLQFDLEGNFIKEWECMMDVKRELGIDTGHIAKCCKGILKKTGGYVWKYK